MRQRASATPEEGRKIKKDSPEPPRLSLKPSRLEGHLYALHVTAAMLQPHCRSVNIS
jgi:hypothetical protein